MIASMIEKETPAPEERQLVSAVIYNRLHARMPSASTRRMRYGLHVPPTESLTSRSSHSDKPYNTRDSTPACRRRRSRNPGLASLQAAAHPAKVNYLYFVAKPDKKHHFFTASFDAFEQYKAEHGYG